MFTAILLSPTPESGSLVVWFFGALVVWFGGSIGYHGFVSRSRIKCGTTEIVLVDGARLRIEIPDRAERVRNDGVFPTTRWGTASQAFYTIWRRGREF